jgi:hypothetical protein
LTFLHYVVRELLGPPSKEDWWWHCPVCDPEADGSSLSFLVDLADEDNWRFCCRDCDWKGDVLAFVQGFCHLPEPLARLVLGQLWGEYCEGHLLDIGSLEDVIGRIQAADLQRYLTRQPKHKVKG